MPKSKAAPGWLSSMWKGWMEWLAVIVLGIYATNAFDPVPPVLTREEKIALANRILNAKGADVWLRNKSFCIHGSRSELTDEDLARFTKQLKLAGGDRIRRLDLSYTGATDESLKTIATMEHLRHLNLRGTRMTGRQFQQIAGLKHLWDLDISQCPLTDEAWNVLPQLAELNWLTYENSVLTATQARVLVKCKTLAHISLTNTTIGPAARKILLESERPMLAEAIND